jgi:hypothetical protein
MAAVSDKNVSNQGTNFKGPKDFSAKGITMTQVSKFIKNICGGEEAMQGKTVEQVKLEYLLPFTNEHQRSYIDIVNDAEGEGPSAQANVYVVYSWKDPFLDVFYSLLHHLKKTPDAVIWWDFFSLNQYSLPGLLSKAITSEYVTCASLVLAINFVYLGETIRSMMELVDRVVFCFSPLIASTPLTRTWCLWELFCATDAKKSLEVAMIAKQDHILDLLESIDNSFTSIRITTSESSLFEDKAQILEVISATIGFTAVESMIVSLLRTWLMSVSHVDCGFPTL